MKISVDWLNEYLSQPLSTREMADALECAGVEVEEVVSRPALDAKIVVGEVKALKPHPKADKLQVAEVETGHANLRIVCGAPNIAVGQRVPVALIGATLPDGSMIQAVSLRGVESQGMLCSEEELGLSSNAVGIMVLGDSALVGEKAEEFISGSDVINATTAANRWDLNGMVWLAREVAAHSNQKSAISEPEHLSSSAPQAEVLIRSNELVDRYLLAHLKVNLAQPSPEWLQQRLQATGVRQVNVVVDITNYCMLEYGQPLHAFDAAKLTQPVTVRLAAAGEKLTTLDGVERALDPSDLLITDANGPIGIAGVMGGRNSEIDAATTAIYLESASFNGPSLRQTAIRHGLRTDASARFERRLPVNLAPLVLARAVQLLIELADGELVGGPTDHLHTLPVETHIAVQPERINALLGLDLSREQIAGELAKLEFGLEEGSAGLVVTPPWWRPDVHEEADVAEEVMKLIGYDALPATLPAWAPQTVSFDQIWAHRWQTVAVLRSLGLFEVVTYSFIGRDQITSLGRVPDRHLKLKNPLSIEQAHLRTDLLPSLLRVAEQNRTYGSRFGLFELSKVYLPRAAGELPKESLHLGVLARKETGSYRAVKAALDRLSHQFNVDLQLQPGGSEKAVAHPTRAATISVNSIHGSTDSTIEIGWIGQLHPQLVASTKIGGEVGYLELNWSRLIAAAQPVRHYQLSRYPSITRDLSVVIDRKLTWQEVAAALESYRPAFVSDYYGDDLPSDKKALALRLTFVSATKTLTDAEADTQLGQVTHLLKQCFQAEIRR